MIMLYHLFLAYELFVDFIKKEKRKRLSCLPFFFLFLVLLLSYCLLFLLFNKISFLLKGSDFMLFTLTLLKCWLLVTVSENNPYSLEQGFTKTMDI